MFASILSVAHNLGYPALVLLVMSESSGVPLPGETALITGAVLASQHRLQIALVIAWQPQRRSWAITPAT